MATPFNELRPKFSPDGSVVAYTSDETGEHEVYVRGLSGGSPQRVSRNGGDFPLWRRDWRELVFAAPDGTIMSTEVSRGESKQFSTAIPLFKVSFRSDSASGYQYDMAP